MLTLRVRAWGEAYGWGQWSAASELQLVSDLLSTHAAGRGLLYTLFYSSPTARWWAPLMKLALQLAYWFAVGTVVASVGTVLAIALQYVQVRTALFTLARHSCTLAQHSCAAILTFMPLCQSLMRRADLGAVRIA
jgi:hypothetical protein